MGLNSEIDITLKDLLLKRYENSDLDNYDKLAMQETEYLVLAKNIDDWMNEPANFKHQVALLPSSKYVLTQCGIDINE